MSYHKVGWILHENCIQAICRSCLKGGEMRNTSLQMSAHLSWNIPIIMRYRCIWLATSWNTDYPVNKCVPLSTLTLYKLLWELCHVHEILGSNQFLLLIVTGISPPPHSNRTRTSPLLILSDTIPQSATKGLRICIRKSTSGNNTLFKWQCHVLFLPLKKV